jgi:hypothetical protein
MRLVQGGCVEDRPHATHTTPHARAVGYRADVSGKRRLKGVEADDLALQVLQGADQGLAKVPGASCNQDSPARVTSPALPESNPTLAAERCMINSERQNARFGRVLLFDPPNAQGVNAWGQGTRIKDISDDPIVSREKWVRLRKEA